MIGTVTIIVEAGGNTIAFQAPLEGDVLLDVEEGEPQAVIDADDLRKDTLRALRDLYTSLRGRRGGRLWARVLEGA